MVSFTEVWMLHC